MKRWLLVGALLMSQIALADWELNNQQSTLTFLSTKNGSVTEAHTFSGLAGSLDDEGAALLKIDLNSVETGIQIRNERIREFLFQTGQFPVAEIKLKVDNLNLTEIQPGSMQRIAVNAALNLHGISKQLDTDLRVIGLKDSAIYVSTVDPIILSAADFALLQGIDKLKGIAKLQSIDTSLPVTFGLIFDRK